MKEAVSIPSFAQGPALVAYECPKCGQVTSVLEQPSRPHWRRHARTDSANVAARANVSDVAGKSPLMVRRSAGVAPIGANLRLSLPGLTRLPIISRKLLAQACPGDPSASPRFIAKRWMVGSIKMLVYYETHDTAIAAIQREKNIKHWPREWKIDLILSMNPNWRDLYEEIIR
jgi:hypothetical protein